MDLEQKNIDPIFLLRHLYLYNTNNTNNIIYIFYTSPNNKQQGGVVVY